MPDLATVFSPAHQQRPLVAVQGLGFVGSAMAAALAMAKDGDGHPLYRVVGVDLPSADGAAKIAAANSGVPPIRSSDAAMDAAYKAAHAQGNFFATSDAAVFTAADIVIVDIPFDVQKTPDSYEAGLEPFLASMRGLAQLVNPAALVIVETTVPPGTTEKYLQPLFLDALKKRGCSTEHFSLAHSYERVTPGADYLRSITEFYRVYAGVDAQAGERAKKFLESFINTKDFPLTQLHRPAASEMAKVMENSYRALNIAFLQEWTEFAEGMNVDMFGVLSAIRMRPTHKNIMSPGFGVGGYCLTKDALLADWACYTATGKHLPLSQESIRINDAMPKYSVQRLQDYFGPFLKGRTLMLMGVSYLNDVADTRYSPSEIFVKDCIAAGATVKLHDTLVSYWPELQTTIENSLIAINDRNSVEAVILAVRHKEYMAMTAAEWLEMFPNARLFLDANNILSESKADGLRALGVDVIGIGKGHWQPGSGHKESRRA